MSNDATLPGGVEAAQRHRFGPALPPMHRPQITLQLAATPRRRERAPRAAAAPPPVNTPFTAQPAGKPFFLKVKRPCLSVTPLNDGGLASLPVSVCHWRQVDEVFGQQHMGSTNRETQQVRGRPPGRSRPLLLANVWLAAAAGKDGET